MAAAAVLHSSTGTSFMLVHQHLVLGSAGRPVLQYWAMPVLQVLVAVLLCSTDTSTSCTAAVLLINTSLKAGGNITYGSTSL